MSGEVVKFPIGRVVREHRVRMNFGGSVEANALDAVLHSVDDALASLKRQRSSLLMQFRAARERETPDERARASGRVMARVFMRQAEDDGGEDQGDAA
jgi:hypothetical protein